MRKTPVIAFVLLLSVVGLVGSGCGKRKEPQKDISFYQTPEGTHEKIQELRLELTEALEKKNLQHIHDSMFYFKNLCTALSARLQGERKQRVDGVLQDLTLIAEAIDNSAGRGNQAATEANLRNLIETLKELETEFKDSSKGQAKAQ